MKKLIVMCLAILANVSFIACSPESVEGIINPSQEQFATEGEDGKVDPPDLPPGGGKG